MLSAERAAELKAEADADLVVAEAEYERVRTQVETLRQISSLYGQMVASSPIRDLPARIVTLPVMEPVVPSEPVTRSTDNFTTRVTRLLKAEAPGALSARQILIALKADGWVTVSKNPIMIVRNTMADLVRRVPELYFRKNPDGTVEYGWHEVQPNAEGTS